MKYLLLTAEELEPFLPGLRALEDGIVYPLTKDNTETFVIRHGGGYHPFFSDMGEPRFVLAVEGSHVLGVVTVVLRPVVVDGRRIRAAYLCDLKVAPAYRGRHLARNLCLMGLWLGRREPRLYCQSLAYGVTMRGAKGDVTRSFGRGHPARLGRAMGTLAIYFVPQPRLATLDIRRAPTFRAAQRLLDLSPHVGLAPVSTHGKKDLLLGPSRLPMNLVHLGAGPSKWDIGGLGAYLKDAAQCAPASSTLCFAIDLRLSAETEWLCTQGIVTESRATVYAARWPFLESQVDYVHISTSEI